MYLLRVKRSGYLGSVEYLLCDRKSFDWLFLIRRKRDFANLIRLISELVISKRKVTQVAIQGESKEGQFCESRIHVPYQEGHSFECFLIFEGFDFKPLISFSNLQNFLNES